MDIGIVLLCLALCCWLLLPCLLPVRSVRLQLGILLAADNHTLAPSVSGNQVAVIVAPFVPSESLVLSDLTLATTNGLAPILCATGTQETATDPVSDAQIITLIPAAGTGFRWVTSGTFPPTIIAYGFALVDNGIANLLGVEQLAVPISFTATGQQLEADPQQMVFVLQPLS